MSLAYDPSNEALYHPERHDTLFASGQTYPPVQLAVEAARLAYYRAEVSPTERDRLVDALGRAGFGDLVFFSNPGSGAAAFAARCHRDGSALLSFRGTQPDNYKNWLADVEFPHVAWPESAGRVHEGFAGDFRSLAPQILTWMEAAKPDAHKLIVTGHSLGAAMATLAATLWRPEWLVTIGSPRVGDAVFAATVKATHIVRFVDCCDGVTEVPPAIFGFEHVEARTYLTRNARTVVDPPEAVVESDQWFGRLGYALKYGWQIWRDVLIRDLADHAPINYLRAIFPAD